MKYRYRLAALAAGALLVANPLWAAQTTTNPKVQIQTNMGDIVLELNA